MNAIKAVTDANLALAGVGVAHHFGGGSYVKETKIPAGASLRQHAHSHDHISYLVSGQVVVRVDGEATTVTGPCPMLIRAGQEHGLTAMTDALWLCIWATDLEDPEAVDDAVVSGKPLHERKE